jgi:hypothetical protein
VNGCGLDDDSGSIMLMCPYCGQNMQLAAHLPAVLLYIHCPICNQYYFAGKKISHLNAQDVDELEKLED